MTWHLISMFCLTHLVCPHGVRILCDAEVKVKVYFRCWLFQIGPPAPQYNSESWDNDNQYVNHSQNYADNRKSDNNNNGIEDDDNDNENSNNNICMYASICIYFFIHLCLYLYKYRCISVFFSVCRSVFIYTLFIDLRVSSLERLPICKKSFTARVTIRCKYFPILNWGYLNFINH